MLRLRNCALLPINIDAISGFIKLVSVLSSPLNNASLTAVALISSILGISVTSIPALWYLPNVLSSLPEVIAMAPFNLANFLLSPASVTSINFGKPPPV